MNCWRERRNVENCTIHTQAQADTASVPIPFNEAKVETSTFHYHSITTKTLARKKKRATNLLFIQFSVECTAYENSDIIWYAYPTVRIRGKYVRTIVSTHAFAHMYIHKIYLKWLRVDENQERISNKKRKSKRRGIKQTRRKSNKGINWNLF